MRNVNLLQPENCITTYSPQAFVVIYSVVDRTSLSTAEEILQTLWKSETISSKSVILVGNKADLVRSRAIPFDGKHFFLADFYVTLSSGRSENQIP